MYPARPESGEPLDRAIGRHLHQVQPVRVRPRRRLAIGEGRAWRLGESDLEEGRLTEKSAVEGQHGEPAPLGHLANQPREAQRELRRQCRRRAVGTAAVDEKANADKHVSSGGKTKDKKQRHSG